MILDDVDEIKSNSFSVYVHQNIKTNRTYVGITEQIPPCKRWNNGNGYKKNIKFYKDIQKYGFDKFEHRIVCSGLTQEQAVKIELELIKAYDSCNKGYNNSKGGKYATKTPLNSTATKLKQGFKNHDSFFKDAWGFSPYDLFLEAEKAGADSNLCQNLNIHCEKIIEIFWDGNFSFSDKLHLMEFWIYLASMSKQIERGDCPDRERIPAAPSNQSLRALVDEQVS